MSSYFTAVRSQSMVMSKNHTDLHLNISLLHTQPDAQHPEQVWKITAKSVVGHLFHIVFF